MAVAVAAVSVVMVAATMKAVAGKGSEGDLTMTGPVLTSQKSQFPAPKEPVAPARAKPPSPVTTSE